MRSLTRVPILIIPFMWFASCSVAKQNRSTATDTLLESTFKENGKCKRVIKGTRRTGSAYYYFKKNGKLLSIQSRRQYKTGKKVDSSAVYYYYFINDSLVKTVYYRHIYLPGKTIQGFTELYYKMDSVTESFQEGDAPIPDLNLILREAYAHLIHFYKMDKRHRFRKSTQLNFG
jgi:hypothetical protein